MLSMDDGFGGSFTTVYDGSEDNNNLSYLVTSLTTGYKYTFIVYALNFNGQSLPSLPMSYFVCSEP